MSDLSLGKSDTTSRALLIRFWNIYCFNSDFEKAIEFIRRAKFDVFGLAEVPEEVLVMLERMCQEEGIHICSGCDTLRVRKSDGEGTWDSLVILSRHPLRDAVWHPYPPYPKYNQIADWFDRYTTREEEWVFKSWIDRGWLSVYAEVKGREIQIICAHPTVWSWSRRREEIGLVLSGMDRNVPSVVCGDFNVLEGVHRPLLNALFGDKLRYSWLGFSERKKVERMFHDSGLWNPLRGKSTYTLRQFGLTSEMQLDHVLLPKRSVVQACEAGEFHGSDHRPVQVTVWL